MIGMQQSDENQNNFHDVYVAYCDKDLNFAREIINKIENKGLRCYFKDRDERNGYVLENLCQESRNSRLILIIYTEHSIEDCLIKFLTIQSLHYTLDFGKLTLILLLHNIDKKRLPKEVLFVPHVFTSEMNYFETVMEKLTAPKVNIDNLLPVGNISSGLVWSFYYGYLKIILPEIPIKINEWISCNPSKSKYFPRQLYIILPTFGNCYSSLSEVDNNIEFVETFTSVEIDRAGNRNRNYKNTIYKICRPDKEYYFVGEYASPVKTMFEMEKGQIAGLTKSDFFQQVYLFKEKLSQILNHKDCPCHCCTLVIYNNDPLLSDLLGNKIEEDLKAMNTS